MAASPSTANYTLGRGILYIGLWVGTTPPVSLSDVGNCSEFTTEVTEETLDHKSSRSGTKNIDKSAILETGYNLSFVLDEISLENLRMFLKGTLDGSSVIHANTALDQEYAIRFVSDNPSGPNQTWNFWRVKLSPNGAFGLITDEWSTLSFNGKGLTDSANHVDTPYFNVDYGTTTTT